MKWKQFLTPVKSIDADQGHKLLSLTPKGEFTLLDVRQPREYERSHIPGSKLIPLTNLNDRLAELDPNKATLVY